MLISNKEDNRFWSYGVTMRIIEASIELLSNLDNEEHQVHIDRSLKFMLSMKGQSVQDAVRYLLNEYNQHRFEFDNNTPDNGTDYYAVTHLFSVLTKYMAGQDFVICVYWHSLAHMAMAGELRSMFVDLLIAKMEFSACSSDIVEDYLLGIQASYEFIRQYASFTEEYTALILVVHNSVEVFETTMDLSFIRREEIVFDEPRFVTNFDHFLKTSFPQFNDIFVVTGH